ncbi:MFS transporter [Corynebacterium sp. TA-R-1]|uniref:MFS transporter n=1 Tax=Corynebacterium stercoris TaxID=2943490 RepID=A0ABT1G2V9_9CORY|nr:MFS transporter [Corynebacterium stercoris]MCP1388364.1 MFS transporter [Corynebacterium stercoris]
MSSAVGSNSPAPAYSPEQIAASEKMSGVYLRIAIGACLINIAMAVSFTAMSFFTPVILGEFTSFSASEFLIYYTLLGICSALSMPLAGQLVDKIKAQGLLILGGSVTAAGLVLFGISSKIWMFYLAGIIIGLGVGLSAQYVPVVVINRWFIKGKGTVLGIALAGSGIGGAIFGAVLPKLIDATGWRPTAFFLAAFFAAFTVLPALFLIRNSPADARVPAFGQLSADADQTATAGGVEPGLTQAEAYKSPGFYVLAFSVLLLGITYGLTQHLVNYLSNTPWDIYVPPEKISAVIVTEMIALIIFKPFLGWLIDKIGLMKTLWITLGFAAIAVLVSTWVTFFIPYLVLIVFMSLGAANGTVSPPLIAQAAFGQRDFAKIWGVLGMAFPIGLALGTPLWGWFPERFGSYGMGFVLVPVATLIFLIGFQFAVMHTRKQWATAPLAAA